jgi:hypothetical protein
LKNFKIGSNITPYQSGCSSFALEHPIYSINTTKGKKTMFCTMPTQIPLARTVEEFRMTVMPYARLSLTTSLPFFCIA